MEAYGRREGGWSLRVIDNLARRHGASSIDLHLFNFETNRVYDMVERLIASLERNDICDLLDLLKTYSISDRAKGRPNHLSVLNSAN